MKFLIINTDYPAFLRSLYSEQPELHKKTYEEQLGVRNETLFGVADFYSRNLRKLGHEAWEIHANNFLLQSQWMKEFGQHNGTLPLHPQWQSVLTQLRGLAHKKPIAYGNRFLGSLWKFLDAREQRLLFGMLSEQIRHYHPDVLLNQDIALLNNRFLREIRPYTGTIVGQHASLPMPPIEQFRDYDFVISSSPSIVEVLKSHDVECRLNRLAFEKEILKQLPEKEELYDVTFVGSFVPGIHDARKQLIEHLAERFENLAIWTPDINRLSKGSSIRKRYKGNAWGIKLYEILIKSRITLNRHFDLPQYANNMRLFEATGVGSLLITDWKENLDEIFSVDKEVVAYSNTEECCERIQYYLEHASERKEIAAAGQQRTLTEHTYLERMKEFVGMLE